MISVCRCGLALLGILAVLSFACSARSSTPSKDSGLHTIRDIPLPGDTSRFDYESFDPRTGRLYIAHLGAGSIIVFDTRTNAVVATINDVPGVHGVLAVPQVGRLYASVTDKNELAVIDANTLSVVASVPAGDYPDGVAYDPDAGCAAVLGEHIVYDVSGTPPPSEPEAGAVCLITARRHDVGERDQGLP